MVFHNIGFSTLWRLIGANCLWVGLRPVSSAAKIYGWLLLYLRFGKDLSIVLDQVLMISWKPLSYFWAISKSTRQNLCYTYGSLMLANSLRLFVFDHFFLSLFSKVLLCFILCKYFWTVNGLEVLGSFFAVPT